MADWIVYVSLLCTVLAGGGIVLLLRPSLNKNLKLLLSFSGAYLLAISVLHLIPEVYDSPAAHIGVYVLVGFLLQLLLEFFSEGIEHGHVHVHEKVSNSFPITIMLSLCIHSFLEGMPLEREIHHIHHATHEHPNHSLLLGILFHKLPVSIALMTMLLKSKVSKVRAFIWLMVFAIMAPLGTFVSHHFGSVFNEVTTDFLDKVLAIVVGMFLHISTTILFESSEGHRFNFLKLITILAGAAIAMLSL